jgi:hypothetical protein
MRSKLARERSDNIVFRVAFGLRATTASVIAGTSFHAAGRLASRLER